MGRVTSTAVGQYQASERHFVGHTRQAKRDGSTRGLLYCPAKTQTAEVPILDPIGREIIDTSGLLVCSFDLGSTAASFQWGNDTARTRVGTAASYMASTLGAKTGGVLLYGGSSGFLACCAYAAQNPGQVRAIASAISVIDLQYIHDGDINGNATSIEDAYGGAAQYPTNIVGHSPIDLAAAMSSVPVKLWVATDDIFTPFSFYENFAAAHGNCDIESLGAVGHSQTTINPKEVTDFLNLYA